VEITRRAPPKRARPNHGLRWREQLRETGDEARGAEQRLRGQHESDLHCTDERHHAERESPDVVVGGCAHNLLGTASVAAAIAANRERVARKLPGTIQLFGTPAEEIGFGKTFMIRDRAFKRTDVVLAWHPRRSEPCHQPHPARRWAQTACAAHPLGYKGMAVAAKMLAASAIDVLTDPSLLKAAHDEFLVQTKGKPYVSPLPPGAKPVAPR